MAAAKYKYSLWLVPKGRQGQILQDLIEKITKQTGTASFVPHITLVADIFADDAELGKVKTRLDNLSKQLKRFTVTVADYGHKDEESRSLYLHAHAPELPNLYDQAAKVFPQIANEHFRQMPHLSVLYGNFPEVTKMQVIAGNPVQPAVFEVNSIDLYKTDNPIERWQPVQAFWYH